MNHSHHPPNILAACKVWVHDDSFSSKDVLFNLSAFPTSGISEGLLLLVAPALQDHSNSGVSQQAVREHRDFVFIARDCDMDLKNKHPNLQLSVSNKVAKLFGFKNLTEIRMFQAHKKDHSATHVEICFRDVYVTRANLRRLVGANLLNQAVFEGESISFLGTIRATVRSIYNRGRRVRSALFANHTKPVFRSESARYILYIQMSREMWDFDTEGSGEIIFNRVVQDVLPQLFRRWADSGARHLVSVVLFTRLEMNNQVTSTSLEPHELSQALPELGQNDFYRVVVGEMYSGEWPKILLELQREFKCFLRDVLTSVTKCGASSYPEADIANVLTTATHGNFLEAINLASSRFGKDWIDPDLVRSGLSVIVITPGAGFFQVDETLLRLTNENLVRNGVSIDLICLSKPPLHETPLFGSPHSTALDSRDAFTDTSNNNISTTRYLHPSDSTTYVSGNMHALFSRPSTLRSNYQQSEMPTSWVYVTPQWIQIHFWSSAESVPKGKRLDVTDDSSLIRQVVSSNFTPICRMYEVQMTGIMENEMSDISLPFLHSDKTRILEQARQREEPKAGSSPSKLSSYGTAPKSIYLSSNFRRHLSPKPKTERNSRTFEDQEWMDEYDKAIFGKPKLTYNKKRIQTPTYHPVDRSDRTQAVPTSHADGYGSRYASLSTSPTSFVNSKLRLLKQPSLQSAVLPSSGGSTASTSISRQISGEPIYIEKRSPNPGTLLPLTGSLRGTSKASPSMHHTTEFVTYSHSQRAGSEYTEESLSSITGPISRQVRESLLRKSSSSKFEQAETRAIDVSSNSNAVYVPKSKRKDISSDGEGFRPSSRSTSNQGLPTRPDPQARSFSYGDNSNRGENHRAKEEDLSLAISPWLSVCNPSRRRDQLRGMAAHHGWTHVFVHQDRTFSVKWKSLCSPAVLPLASDYIPSREMLKAYEENSYKLTLSDDELAEIPKARARLMDQMVSFRLGKGFQMLPKASSARQESDETNNIHFYEGAFEVENTTLLMSKGNAIHVIHGSGPEVQVTRYRPKYTVMQSEVSLDYTPRIKTTFEKNYVTQSLTMSALPEDLNWSIIDNFLAGYPSTFTNTIGFWRARFVLIPIGPPSSARRPFPALAEDSDDEIYIEGIQRLTQLWERCRLRPYESQSVEPVLKPQRKDPNPNPLNLEFQTRDPSAVIFAGLDESLLQEDQNQFPTSQLFSDTEPYHSNKIDIKKLAYDLQSEIGIKMYDRRWYFRVHPNCFVGLDLTSWLLYHVQDVDNREFAIQLGQSLMDKGLFKHVSGRHKFRDGNYFYQITAEYRSIKSDSRAGWFSRRSEKISAPSTPHLDAISAGTTARTNHKTLWGTEWPTDASRLDQRFESGKARPNIRLSSVIQCDIDFKRRSDRPEVIDVHYDRLYNPDSCYHFRLEWMNATAKLIGDAISSWATNAERYGLRLVQVPLAEASIIAETNPFRSPYIIELAVEPPKSVPDSSNEVLSPNLRAVSTLSTQHFYKALLRKFGFILDSEASSNFPSDVNISYSWGHDVPYKYSQYIHKTGVILAQISDEGSIILVANRLADNRSSHIRESGRADRRAKRDDDYLRSPNAKENKLGTTSLNRKSLLTSPSIAPTTEGVFQQYIGFDENQIPTAEQLKDQIEAFCQNEIALGAFFEEVKTREPTHSAKATPLLNATVPKLDLPSVTDLTLLSEGEVAKQSQDSRHE